MQNVQFWVDEIVGHSYVNTFSIYDIPSIRLQVRIFYAKECLEILILMTEYTFPSRVSSQLSNIRHTTCLKFKELL